MLAGLLVISNNVYFINEQTLHSLCVEKVWQIGDRGLGLGRGHSLLKDLLVVEPHFREPIVGRGTAVRRGNRVGICLPLTLG